MLYSDAVENLLQRCRSVCYLQKMI